MITPAAIKVTIVEDVTNIREGLKALIDGTDGYTCTGALSSMEEAIPHIAGSRPDVVLLDIGLPGMSGIAGLRKLKDANPELAVLILTVYDDDNRIFEALCEGACGYLLKKTPPVKLLECIKEAISGGAPMSPEIARRVVALFREFQPPRESTYQLTPHEMRLLKLLVDGHNYKSAAAELNVSVNTIRFHMRSVYDKLQVHSKSEAVSKALRNRIIR